MSEIIAKVIEGEEIKLKIENGYLVDRLSSVQIKDGPEERMVQALISFLLDNKGYRSGEIIRKKRWRIQIGRSRTEIVEADLVIELNGFTIILIEAKAPGTPLDQFKAQALSYAKLHSPPIPIVVLTNDPPQLGSTWIYDVFTEKLKANTLTAIPSRSDALRLVRKGPPKLTYHQIQQAKQRLLTFTDTKEFARVFNRCHNMIRTQKGMDARQRLFELCKIILIKFHEEKRLGNGEEYRFSISAMEDAKHRLGMESADFMNRIFDNVKDKLSGLFEADIKLELGPATIKSIVQQLEDYSFTETREDVLGAAFETFLRGTMTGRELGEFFTPREVVDFMVKVVAPSVDETVLDPACGSGGFLLQSFSSVATSLITDPRKEKKLAQYIENCLWGMDIDEYLVQLCKINLKIHGDGFKNIYRCDSLNLRSSPEIWDKIKNILDTKGGFDIILTNPPFGSGQGNIITDPKVLEQFELGKYAQGTLRRSQIPQVLFLELCLKLLRPGGRLGIVLPDGILNNPSENYLCSRQLFETKAVVEAIASLPEGTFHPYGSLVKASIVFAKKRKDTSIRQNNVLASIPKFIGYRTDSKNYRQTEQNDFPDIIEAWQNAKVDKGVLDRWFNRVIPKQFSLEFDSPAEGIAFAVNSMDLTFTNLSPEFYFYKYMTKKLLESYPSSWALKPLSELASFPQETLNPTKYPEQRFIYVEIGDIDIRSGRIFAKEPSLGLELSPGSYYVLRKGDIIISRVRPYRRGIAMVPKWLDRSLGTKGFMVIRTRQFDPRILVTILRSSIVIKQLEEKMGGSTYPTIRGKTPDILGSIKIPIPPQPIQNKMLELFLEMERLILKEENYLINMERFLKQI